REKGRADRNFTKRVDDQSVLRAGSEHGPVDCGGIQLLDSRKPPIARLRVGADGAHHVQGSRPKMAEDSTSPKRFPIHDEDLSAAKGAAIEKDGEVANRQGVEVEIHTAVGVKDDVPCDVRERAPGATIGERTTD